MDDTYSIGDLAREFDVTTRTIRFYEDKGLIAPARQGQRRVYSGRDRVRLKLIMRGKRLGFSLEEVREMVDLYDEDKTEVAQLLLFVNKIEERQVYLAQQSKDIAATLDELEARKKQCFELLEERKRSAARPPALPGEHGRDG